MFACNSTLSYPVFWELSGHEGGGGAQKVPSAELVARILQEGTLTKKLGRKLNLNSVSYLWRMYDVV